MKILLAAVLSLLLFGNAQAKETTFIFAHINESIMPIQRGEKYEDPLDDFLRQKGLGEVTGGGTAQSANGKIEWVGVDIELVDIEKNLPVLIHKLKELGAPKGSFFEYTLKNKPFKKYIHNE
ncbi:MAG: hypothetical protein OEZ39_16670 [Gammaproteobacteria bacterium]|nr:hypothetical protein [Gammaproteobacteria bacterium]MDH5653494.1 hypothetical protein [Gammaproteobacteria bacterium]